MNRLLAPLLAVLVALPLAADRALAVSDAPGLRSDATAVLVAFDPVPSPVRDRIVGEHGGRRLERLARLRIDVVQVPDGVAPEAFAAVLSGRREVRYAVPDRRWHALASDPDFPLLWGLQNDGQTIEGSPGVTDVDVDAPSAWLTTRGETETVVGVVDEGIDVTHPDLYERIFLNAAELPAPTTDDGDSVLTVHDYADTPDANGNGYVDADDLRAAYADGVDGPDPNTLVDDIAGWDFADGDPQVWDGAAGRTCGTRHVDDHGTHVAGTIAATANDAGVVGVAPSVRLLPLKFLGCGGGDTSDALAALLYADDFAVPVYNHSWGAGGVDPALRDALAATDAVHVAAAGNSGADADARPLYPAAFDLANVVSVAAIDNRGARAGFSNYGARTVDLGAPGEDTYSTLGGSRYGYLSGTSMAAPHVAGVAALVASHAPATSTARMVEVLRCGVEPLPSLWGRTVTGGLTKADTTLGALDRPGPPTAFATTTTEDAVTVTWEPPAHPVGAAITGYEVRLDPAGPVRSLGPGARSTTFEGLERGEVHRITVVATTYSGPSCAATGPVLIAGPPDAPQGVHATAGDETVTVHWQAPADDNGAPVRRYEASLRGPDGSRVTVTTAASARSQPFKGLVNGSTYTAEVRAANDAGTGPPGVSEPAKPVGPPGTPMDVTAEPRDRGALVRWSPPLSDGGSPVTTYDVSAFAAGGPTAAVPVNTVEVDAPTTLAEIGGLVNGQAYEFSVTATNAEGTGEASVRSAAVVPKDRLTAPDGLVATPRNGMVALSWEGVEGADDYLITAEPGGHHHLVRGTGADFDGLTNGVRYRIAVAARDGEVAGHAAEVTSTPLAPTLRRVAGDDRYETTALAARAAFPAGAPVVYLATGADFPDALAAAAAAATDRAPVLLTRPDLLPGATAAELVRLAPDQVVVVGGTTAISESVAQDVAATTGAVVTRVSGPDRYATSAAVSADAFPTGAPTVYVATGADFPDALALAAASGSALGPVLLVPEDGVPLSISTELRRLDPDRVVLAGGLQAVPRDIEIDLTVIADAPVTRVAGPDRYATAVALATTYADPHVPVVHVATGADFPDAIAGGAVAAATAAPLLLVPRDGGVPPSVTTELGRLRPAAIQVLGGRAAISDAVAALVLGAAS